MMPSGIQPNASPEKKHSITWIIFIIFISLIGIALLAFAAMFSYYLWVEKYGSEQAKQQLTERFADKFTATPGSQAGASTIEQDIQSIIREYNPRYGNSTAAVTIVAFIDFECPYCQEAHPEFERIRERFGPAVQIVFKHFPIEQFHPHAMNSARAAQCAHKQGKFWPYYEQLFNRKLLTDEALFQYAAQLGMNTNQFATCLIDSSVQQQINTDLTDGVDIGVRGTPTYLINQQKVEGVVSEQQWESLILQALNQ